MRLTASLLVVLTATRLACGQSEDPVKIEILCRIDGGLGAILAHADGKRQPFHIEASALRARLVSSRSPSEAGTREIAVGSAEEAQLLRALESWCAATFTTEQQQELLAPDKLPDPRTQEQDDAHQRASLLRTVRRYVEVTRPKVTKVFAGRETVSLSLHLQLGDSPVQQLLWRRLGTEAFARLHLDTDVVPVPISSRAESRMLLGLANWLAMRLGGPDALWQPEPPDLAEDVRLVLRAWRGYHEATSPRMRSAGTIMDAGNNGSKRFEVSDAQNRVTVVRFDHAGGTPTPGRLFDGPQIVDLGSKREGELLTILARTAELRRGWFGAEADKDWQLVLLETELDAYRKTFLAPK
ncbi:MAG: hypothetical protein Q7T30_02750 [Planctomycetota bacterium]|nr:hypothetical protein [Planctomycetota bacterium]